MIIRGLSGGGGHGRIRTAVEGFADLCLATRPRDHLFKQVAKIAFPAKITVKIIINWPFNRSLP